MERVEFFYEKHEDLIGGRSGLGIEEVMDVIGRYVQARTNAEKVYGEGLKCKITFDERKTFVRLEGEREKEFFKYSTPSFFSISS